MIVQGSNLPLVLITHENMSNVQDLKVALFDSLHHELKSWRYEDVTINGKNIICPLTQADTLALPVGICIIELKILTNEGIVVLNKSLKEYVHPKDDSFILGDDSLITEAHKSPTIHISVVSGINIYDIDGGSYDDWKAGD